MSRRLLARCIALFVFVVALLLYGSTVVPTVAFWDTGEFIASAHTLQVNHSSEAPLYLLLSPVTSLLVPAEDVALTVLALFLATGGGILLSLNQIPMLPRSREDSFVENFLAVDFGAAGRLERLWAGLRRPRIGSSAVHAAGGVGLTLLFVAVPGHMLDQNYDDHDRSGRQEVRDFAYNMLTSVAEDSILFTYGDNDTYPLWYLQNVEGVRPDVRVVNLSLLGTAWYIKQLKDGANASEPLPMSLSDAQIEQLRYRSWSPREVEIPVQRSALLSNQPELKMAVTDTHPLEQPMSWRLSGRQQGGGQRALSVADQVVYNILRTNAEQGWKRPVYFSVTTPPSSHINLEPYFQLEGLAHRVVPIRDAGGGGRVVPGLTEKRFSNFRLTNLDDPDAYYGETARRTIGVNYRVWPARAARGLARQGHAERARSLLDRFMKQVPFDVIPADSSVRLEVARAYQAADAPNRAQAIAQSTEPLVLNDLRSAEGRRSIRRALRTAGSLRTLYRKTGATKGLARFDDELVPLLEALPVRLPAKVRQGFGLPERDGRS